MNVDIDVIILFIHEPHINDIVGTITTIVYHAIHRMLESGNYYLLVRYYNSVVLPAYCIESYDPLKCPSFNSSYNNAKHFKTYLLKNVIHRKLLKHI